ncbi:MAG: M15 family metallopeptidase [DPANN group archaeon]|nr:M15 family metallopeptidase [DPANN group archaeon]
MQLLLAGLAILMILPIITSFLGTPGSKDAETQATIDNFNGLGNSIQALLDGPDYGYRDTTLSLRGGYAIVGFDKNWKRISGSHTQADRYRNGGAFFKPSACGDAACICLYDDDIKENDLSQRDVHVVQCIPFAGDVSFISRYQRPVDPIDDQQDAKPRMCGTRRQLVFSGLDEPLKTGPYGYFVIYGDKCGQWDAQKLYLERLRDQNPDPESTDSRIFIYGAIEDDSVRDRIATLVTYLPQTHYTIDTSQLVSIQGIPGITCDETNTDFGKICKAIPPVRDALEKLSTDFQDPTSSHHNYRMVITQAYRDWNIQNDLYQCYKTKHHNGRPYHCSLACYPGSVDNQQPCPHMSGGAIDIVIYDGAGRNLNNMDPARVESVMCQAGFVRFSGEPWHFEMGTPQWNLAMERRAKGEYACTY